MACFFHSIIYFQNVPQIPVFCRVHLRLGNSFEPLHTWVSPSKLSRAARPGHACLGGGRNQASNTRAPSTVSPGPARWVCQLPLPQGRGALRVGDTQGQQQQSRALSHPTTRQALAGEMCRLSFCTFVLSLSATFTSPTSRTQPRMKVAAGVTLQPT